MKKITLILCAVCLLGAAMLAGCGVKTELDRPAGGTFPRNYPVD